jgi:hypothetical protein
LLEARNSDPKMLFYAIIDAFWLIKVYNSGESAFLS